MSTSGVFDLYARRENRAGWGKISSFPYDSAMRGVSKDNRTAEPTRNKALQAAVAARYGWGERVWMYHGASFCVEERTNGGYDPPVHVTGAPRMPLVRKKKVYRVRLIKPVSTTKKACKRVRLIKRKGK